MSCPVCGAARTAQAMTVGAIRFERCRDCRSLFVAAPPAAEQTAGLYSGESYFANEDYDETYLGYKDYLADRHHIEQKFADVLAHLERQVEPGRLLDVGAGPGLLVALARRRGWNASGVEPNPWAVGYAREELGVELHAGTLGDVEYDDGTFDAVTMLDLIEHVADPGELVREAARLVRPGGALAVLTPDAGAPVSRLLGRRWPEVERAPEHLVLFSVRGLAALLARHGFEATGWHSVGKTSSVTTLAADVAPVAPSAARLVRCAVAGRALGRLTFELDPHTKFCLYARRVTAPVGPGLPRPPRVRKRPGAAAPVEEAVLEELTALTRARRLGDWMFDRIVGSVEGTVLEVGAGIGTFSERILAAGADRLVALEPDAGCADSLERRLGGDPRLELRREGLPGATTVSELAGRCDLVVCQNVLEHIDDDAAALADMARALRSGGRLALLVPAHPRLFGPLDERYGHHRRYTREVLRRRVEAAGLEVEDIRPFNLLGVAGWWAKNRRRDPQIGSAALGIYDTLVPVLRVVERVLGPPVGLSLVAQARRPGSAPSRPVR